jgi:putative dehydrogenase
VPNKAERPLLADTVWAALGSQLLTGIHIAAACEAIALAEKLGLDLSKVYEVITTSPWKFLDVREPRAAHPRLFAEERLRSLHQGSRPRVDMARAASFPMPLAASALRVFVMTAASGKGHDDASVVRRYA